MEVSEKLKTISETNLKSGETLIVEGKSLAAWPAVVEEPVKKKEPVIEPGIR